MFIGINLQNKLILYIIGAIVLASLPIIIIGTILLDWSNPLQTTLFIVALVITWLSGFFVASWAASLVIRPIHILNEAVERFAAGDFDYQVPVDGGGEINQLLMSFNNMSVALKESLGYLNQYAADLQMELEEKQRLMEEQKSMYLNFIKSAAKAIEAKDRYTSGHSERVAEYAVKISQQLSLDVDTVENIRVAAALHDIGKIGLQDAILLKPAALTNDEYNIVKQHPAIGGEILAPLMMDEMVLDGVKRHHERYDGKGYPEGKAGAELGIAARIIAVADAFDAMTSLRSYRK
ncbi:MAG: HD domain-containing protein, partial [Bacillota bacterium]|nr:HD domain-containing protein [Bacillota bacterium]